MHPDPPHRSRPPSVDLEVHVTTPWGRQSGERSFQFTLSSPSGVAGFYREQVLGKSFTSEEAKAFQSHIFGQLEDLARGYDVDGHPLLHEEMAEDLVALGQELYQKLCPRELRGIYREIRDKVRTVLFVSDEPWVPWEMLHPTDPDDTFLCLRHVFARWLAGSHSPGSDRRVQRLLRLQGADEETLQQAAAERRFLDELAAGIPGLDLGDFQSNRALDLIQELREERFDLLHFAGHGEHDDKRPGEAKIFLPDGVFRARQLTADVQRKLRAERPLIVFNGCQVGQLSQSFTELGGWAYQWINRCGCGAFLAPAWSVGDGRSLRFSKVFYESLLQGRTLGEAVLEARRVLHAENPGEPTWLAYRLYGGPGARVLFGQTKPSTLPALQPSEKRSSEAPQPKLPTLKPTDSSTPQTSRPSILRSPDSGASRPSGASQPSSEKPETRTSPLILLRERPALALAVVALITLSLVLAFTGPSLNPFDGSTSTLEEETQSPEGPLKTEPDVVDTHEDESAGATSSPARAQESQPPPTVNRQETSTSPPPPPPSSSPFPYQPMVPKKVAVLALDQNSQQPSQRIASALRSVLLSTGTATNVLAPSLAASEIQKLSSGSFPSVPDSTAAPWGAEFLLIATGSFEELPTGSSHTKSLILTLSLDLLRSTNFDLLAHTSGNHTGKDISIEIALKQATEGFMQPITDQLNQGESNEG